MTINNYNKYKFLKSLGFFPNQIDNELYYDNNNEVIKKIIDKKEYNKPIFKTDSPEYMLWCNVLLRAFKDLIKPKYKEKVYKWFFDENSGLEEICGVLRLNINIIKQQAKRIYNNEDNIKNIIELIKFTEIIK